MIVGVTVSLTSKSGTYYRYNQTTTSQLNKSIFLLHKVLSHFRVSTTLPRGPALTIQKWDTYQNNVQSGVE